jgi:putative phage-type endonuclease
MLSDASKKKRAGGIGASEVAALVDEDEHRGPVDLWMSKVGLTEWQETDAMVAGQELESAIGRIYCRMTGARLHSGGGTLRHPKHPWVVATIDRRATGGPVSVVEIKNVGAWQMHAWKHEPPLSKRLQVMWQLEVVGEDVGHIVALLGGTSPRIFVVERDRELIGDLIEIADEFWHDRVLAARRARDAGDEDWARFAPEHNGHEAVRIVEALYPESDGRMLEPSPDAHAAWRALVAAEQAEKDAGAARARAEAAAKELIGDADGIEGLFTWKTDAAGRVAWARVAKELNPPHELIAKHTSPPARRFLKKGSKES